MKPPIIGVIAIAGSVALFSALTYLGKGRGGDRVVTAKVTNALVITEGTPVHVAGIPVGKVVNRELVNGYAELTLAVDEEIPIALNAVLVKRKPSLLANPVLEIDPGTSSLGLLPDGGEIEMVSEQTGSDNLLRDINRALPNIQTKSIELRNTIESLRGTLRTSLSSTIASHERKADSIAKNTENALASIDKKLAQFESRLDFDAQQELAAPLQKSVRRSASLVTTLRKAQNAAVRIGRDARERLAAFDIDQNDNLATFIRKVRAVNRGQGTLGQWVTDPDPADNFAESVERFSGAIGGLLSWDMRVSLRSEYYIRSGLPRNYVSLRMRQRTDTFYVVGVEDSGRGAPPDSTLSYDRATGQWRRDVEIRNDIRWTLQWGRIVGPLSFRAGFKDSTIGAGLDVVTLGDNLELSVDLFELNFAEHPRLKLTTALRVFRHLYVLAGVDDMLNRQRQLDIAPGPDNPRTFDTLYFGRDYFLGATLRFSDDDLAALLAIGGSAVSSAAAPTDDD